jgi:hypothetical protein
MNKSSTSAWQINYQTYERIVTNSRGNEEEDCARSRDGKTTNDCLVEKVVINWVVTRDVIR